jgi:hypothetical protein
VVATLLIVLVLAWRLCHGEKTWVRGAVIFGFAFCLLAEARAASAQVIRVHDDETERAPFVGEAMQEDDLSSDEDVSNSGTEDSPSSSREEEDGEFPDERPQGLPEEEQSFPATTTESAPVMEPPVPQEAPPFLSRPSEWESKPPTVLGAPPLPAAAVFTGRDLAAFQFVALGKENFDQERWEQAEAQFERAVSLSPSLPYSYYFLGRIAFAHRDHKRALAFLQKAELLFPRTERAWLGETDSMKGLVYEDLNDYVQARIAYHNSLRFQPANLKVLSALARLPEEETPPNATLAQ